MSFSDAVILKLFNDGFYDVQRHRATLIRSQTACIESKAGRTSRMENWQVSLIISPSQQSMTYRTSFPHRSTIQSCRSQGNSYLQRKLTEKNQALCSFLNTSFGIYCDISPHPVTYSGSGRELFGFAPESLQRWTAWTLAARNKHVFETNSKRGRYDDSCVLDSLQKQSRSHCQ